LTILTEMYPHTIIVLAFIDNEKFKERYLL